MKVSYPFFKADQIKTPTLFMCGENDFNVPIAGSEQMYQALKSNGRRLAAGHLPEPESTASRSRATSAIGWIGT